VAESERRTRQLAEQRDVLQRQLEKAAEETTGEGGLPAVLLWTAGPWANCRAATLHLVFSLVALREQREACQALSLLALDCIICIKAHF
jgi:hypothetical protein